MCEYACESVCLCEGVCARMCVCICVCMIVQTLYVASKKGSLMTGVVFNVLVGLYIQTHIMLVYSHRHN